MLDRRDFMVSLVAAGTLDALPGVDWPVEAVKEQDLTIEWFSFDKQPNGKWLARAHWKRPGGAEGWYEKVENDPRIEFPECLIRLHEKMAYVTVNSIDTRVQIGQIRIEDLC